MPNFAPKVIVIGERCIDEEHRLKITRINPEHPSTVIGVPMDYSIKGGMAENVVNNLKSLGLKDSEICFVTNETAIVKRRYIEEMTGSIILRVDLNDDVIEKQHEYFDGDKFKDLKNVIENHKTIKVLAVSDYCKGLLDTYWLTQIFNLCKKHGIITIMDTRKKLDPSWAEILDFVKINNKEYKELGETAAHCRNLLVTLGERGIHWVNKNKIFPTKPVNNPSVCGAGDSILSGFIYALLQGKEVEDSIVFANKVARVAVSKPGTSCVTLKEVEELA